jgi:hypothetical protein
LPLFVKGAPAAALSFIVEPHRKTKDSERFDYRYTRFHAITN